MWKFFINDHEVGAPHGWLGADFNKTEPDTITWNHAEANRIVISKKAPINSSGFEEAILLEENGWLTKAGMKEYQGVVINEGEQKPIIDFINK